jgi:hypothetical protein
MMANANTRVAMNDAMKAWFMPGHSSTSIPIMSVVIPVVVDLLRQPGSQPWPRPGHC